MIRALFGFLADRFHFGRDDLRCHSYLRKGKVFVPTFGRVDRGLYRDVEPVAVVDVSDAEALRCTFRETIARGNPPTGHIRAPIRRRSSSNMPALKGGGHSRARVKSIDLTAATYQDAARLTYRLQKYVNDVSEFIGGSMGNDVVGLSDIEGRALSLAVPKDMTAAQREAIEAVRSWARMKNDNPVEVSISEF
jgi:hypothetical protein